MKTNTINKRVYYSYLDDKKGTLTSFIDVDMHVDDDDLPVWLLQKLVQRKWNLAKYKTGFIDTVQFENVQV